MKWDKENKPGVSKAAAQAAAVRKAVEQATADFRRRQDELRREIEEFKKEVERRGQR
jgi:hypothetical protein